MGNSHVGQLWQLGRLVVVAVVGLGCALLFHWRGLEHSTWYTVVASLLLCVGLFMAVYDIDKEEAKREWRIVAVAITLGVLCKYLLIFGALYLSTQDWRYGVLAMALAQIDPLSVAALMGDMRMSARAKTVLSAWASFDDPMTALATPIIVSIIAKTAHVQLDTGTSSTMIVYGVILLVVGTAALLLLRYRRKNTLQNLLTEPHHRAGAAGAIAAGTATRLYSMPAVAGLVFRPAWLTARRAQIIVTTALLGATFLVGVLLAGGVNWMGIPLGIATYASQIAVAWLVLWVAARLPGATRSAFSRSDAWHIALAQQNGITAVVLALNLEPMIPGAIATISLAIITVNLLHFFVNLAYDRQHA